MTCKDSIGKIQESIQRERYCGPNPLPVRKELNELRLAAEKVYGAALERKGKAERIRSSLSLMGRNDDLFALPGKIKSNIAKGNFAGELCAVRSRQAWYRCNALSGTFARMRLAPWVVQAVRTTP